MVDDEDEWEVDDIPDSRLFGKGKWLQCRVKWKGRGQDLDWYNADEGEFDNCQDLVDDFHRRYLTKLKKA